MENLDQKRYLSGEQEISNCTHREQRDQIEVEYEICVIPLSNEYNKGKY